MSERFALYFTPASSSLLYQIASNWLQYDAYKGNSLESSISKNKPLNDGGYENYIQNASKYGFHATLKPPFRLKENHTQEQLIQEVSNFCKNNQAIACGKLQLTTLGSFIALVLEKPCPQLNKLAQQYVETFEPFRAELNKQELKKRNPEELTKRQQVLFKQWGYPYVDDEYRFHLTLTDSMSTEQLPVVKKHLQELLSPALDSGLRVDTVHLFYQENSKSRFKIIRSFPLLA